MPVKRSALRMGDVEALEGLCVEPVFRYVFRRKNARCFLFQPDELGGSNEKAGVF